MRKLSLLLLILFNVILMLVSGCQIIDQSRVQDSETDTIPWNTRAGWEGTTLGVPY